MRGAAGVALLAGLLTACDGGVPMACPAIGYVPSVRVELTGEWTTGTPASVRVTCPLPCALEFREDQEPVEGRELTAEVSGSTASVALPMTIPDSVTATVLTADGTVLTSHEADLDWVRVGGSQECGGPMQATVEVPAP
ncbi:hypothetical protein [Modestobacter sp. SYSU DS0290]